VTADTVLVEGFVYVVGSTVERPDERGVQDVDVLFRAEADAEGKHLLLDFESAQLAVRDVLRDVIGSHVGTDAAPLHYLAHPQGPHQGRALRLADLVLRWREPQVVDVKAGDAGVPTSRLRRLNLGCGENILEGYVNLDRVPHPGVDVVRDFVEQGLPFDDESFDEILAAYSLEDVPAERRVDVFRELWRVLKPGGLLRIEVPHKESAGADMPFHASYWTETTFAAFADPELRTLYDLPAFEIEQVRIDEPEPGIRNIICLMRKPSASALPPQGAESGDSEYGGTKAYAFPKPSMRFATEMFSAAELWRAWADKVPFAVELKYNGYRAIIKRSGDDVEVVYEGTKVNHARALFDADPRFEELVMRSDDYVLDACLMVRQEGEYWPRVKLAALNARVVNLPGGARIVPVVFDVLRWKGEDVTDRSYRERRRLLETEVRRSGFEISEKRVVSSRHELEAALRWARRKGSGIEGLVAKTLDAPYPDRPSTSEWAKIKFVVELKVVVLGARRVENGWIYRCGLLAGHSPFRSVVHGGHRYVDLGNTYKTTIEAKVGDILTVQVEELIVNPDGHTLDWQGPKVIDVDNERRTPYFAMQAVDVAERGGVLYRKERLREEGAATTEWWERHWHEVLPVKGRGKFVYQHHWRGLSEEEAQLGERELLETNHSVHGDLRFEAADGDSLWGFTVFLGTTEAVREAGGDRVATLSRDDALEGSFKRLEPRAWLTVARARPYIAEPGEVGATSASWAKFFEYDSGEYRLGVCHRHFVEFELRGRKIKGHYALMYAPVGGARRWLLRRLDGWYADEHDKERTLAELRSRGHRVVFWGKEGDIEVIRLKGASVVERVFEPIRRLYDRVARGRERPVGFVAFVDKQGRRRFATWTTNCVWDTDAEVFPRAVLEEYVRRNEGAEHKGRLELWHIPGTDFATIDHQLLVGPYLVELAVVDDTPYADAVWRFLTKWQRGHPKVAPYGWGCSHGFVGRRGGEGVYKWLDKHETSILPWHRAANPFVPVEVVKMLTREQIELLRAIGGDELAARIAELSERGAEVVAEVGAELKANVAARLRRIADKVEESDAKTAKTLREIADKIDEGEPGMKFVSQLKKLVDRVGDERDALEKIIRALEREAGEYAYGYPAPERKEIDVDDLRTTLGLDEVTQQLKQIGESVAALSRDLAALGEVVAEVKQRQERLAPGYPPYRASHETEAEDVPDRVKEAAPRVPSPIDEIAQYIFGRRV